MDIQHEICIYVKRKIDSIRSMNSVISKDIEESELDIKSFKPNAFLENSFFNAFF